MTAIELQHMTRILAGSCDVRGLQSSGWDDPKDELNLSDQGGSSPAVGLLRALWTHFASAPFSAPVADFRGVAMPLTAKQLRPLRVRVRAVSGVWGMWR